MEGGAGQAERPGERDLTKRAHRRRRFGGIAEDAGRIIEIRVREGDTVKAGDMIATLDDEQMRAREDQAGPRWRKRRRALNSARQQIAVLRAAVAAESSCRPGKRRWMPRAACGRPRRNWRPRKRNWRSRKRLQARAIR